MAAEAGRVALLSGVSGFVGSALAKGLAARGWEVHGLVRPSSDLAALEASGASPTLHEHDGSTEALGTIVETVAPDAVFHLASLFLVRHEAADVERLVRSNVLFGTQLLEACRLAGVRRFVNAGTAWQHHLGRDEAVNLYAATKSAFEAMLRGYAAFAPLRAVTLKLFDTYGPADRRRKLLTLLLEASERGERLAMSPGEQRIDLLHVDDAVAAFAAAAARLDELADGTHECYALGSGRRPTLKELVALLAGAGAPVEVEWGGRPYREREVMEPWSGGQPLPGWQPRIRLEDGLAALVSGRRGSGD